MRVPGLVFVLILMGSSLAAAAPVSRAPLERIQRNCLSYDFSKITCQATPATDELYQNTETFQNRFQHVAARILVRTLVWNIPPQGGVQLVSQIHRELADYAYDLNLNTCQRAALTACAVNQILEYDDALNDEGQFWQRLLHGLVAPNEFYYSPNSRGICTEFCAVYAQIGRVLGLQVNELANGLHCFNRVRDGNKWIYVEPQEGGRRPYYLNSNRFYLLGIH